MTTIIPKEEQEAKIIITVKKLDNEIAVIDTEFQDPTKGELLCGRNVKKAMAKLPKLRLIWKQSLYREKEKKNG